MVFPGRRAPALGRLGPAAPPGGDVLPERRLPRYQHPPATVAVAVPGPPVRRLGFALVGRRGRSRAGGGGDGPDDALAGQLGAVHSSLPPSVTVAGGNRRLPALVRHWPGHVSILYSFGQVRSCHLPRSPR